MAYTEDNQSPTGDTKHPNPHHDTPGWWSYFFGRGSSWRWSEKPHLYFPSKLEYVAGPNPFAVIDGLGRVKTYDRPFECYIDPFTGKIRRLCVQAPDSICRLSTKAPNATWSRTPIRNAASIVVRLANLPYRFVPAELSGEVRRYNGIDWLVLVLMWIPTVVLFLFGWIAMMFGGIGSPEGKNPGRYLPLLYRGLRYPRLARNILENREQVARRLDSHASWDTKTALSTYRTFRPRFLNYMVRYEEDGRVFYQSECRPVGRNDLTPFVMVCYSSEHYAIAEDPEDFPALLAAATKAVEQHFSALPAHKPRAFWLSANCMPYNKVVDDYGNVCTLESREEQEILENQDTYSISDIIRAAQHVIVVAGNIRKPWKDDALRVWGKRVWTLPEIVLSKGDTVTVYHCGKRDRSRGPQKEYTEIPKPLFPALAWDDNFTSRQLIEHYSNLQLSRLELVKIALECLMNRKFNAKHPGDRAYVLMGLLRTRPPIDKTDSAFQAFARLSLPQDSDRLMERLICLLPETPEQNWELMTDQYKASLWDIYPDTQVCGIGENDTVVVDGAKGAQIQWSGFTKLRTRGRLTLKRRFFIYFIIFSPLIFFFGVILVGIAAPYQRHNRLFSSEYDDSDYDFDDGASFGVMRYFFRAGIGLVAATLALFIIPAPYFLRQLYAGKLWGVEPCFFGIEGYVPLEVIEERLFGRRPNKERRLRWSAWGSPLSRHREGQPLHERAVQYKYPDSNNDDFSPLLPHNHYQTTTPTAPELADVFSLPTYPVEPIDPTSPCALCRASPNPSGTCPNHPTVASLQRMSRSAMGEMKVFTLVDTLNLTATLFYAVRPPTVLVVGGSEGGMKRAIACSFDVTTGTLYRETVLRVPSQSVDCMGRLPRVRVGLRRAFLEGDVQIVGGGGRQGMSVGGDGGGGGGGWEKQGGVE